MESGKCAEITVKWAVQEKDLFAYALSQIYSRDFFMFKRLWSPSIVLNQRFDWSPFFLVAWFE